ERPRPRWRPKTSNDKDVDPAETPRISSRHRRAPPPPRRRRGLQEARRVEEAGVHGRCARCPAVAFSGIYEGVRERSPLVEAEVTGNRIRSLRAFSASENAAEADVASRGVDGLGLSCGGAVA